MLIPYELFFIQSHHQHGQLISEQNPGELNPFIQLGLDTIQTHVTTGGHHMQYVHYYIYIILESFNP